MSKYDKQYLELVKEILKDGTLMPCRTGNNTLVKLNKLLVHDLNEGFPILTFRSLPFKAVKTELYGFLNAKTSKKFYIENGCSYWRQWCNPTKIPHGLSDEERKAYQLQENDLGNIYGFNYRHFSANYINENTDYTGQGFDQLEHLIDTLKKNPYDRRLILTAWDPAHMNTQALPPCLHTFQFNYLGNRLHITGFMRSADLPIGVPTDVNYTTLLLYLVAQTVGMKPGTVTLSMCNCHIYDNQIDIIKDHLQQWDNVQYELPKLELDPFATVFNFKPNMAKLVNYEHGEKVIFPIAV